MMWDPFLVGTQMKAYIGAFNSTPYVFTDIQVEPHDTWSLDVTLAHVILPLLKQFKANSKGSPRIDATDIPEELWPTFQIFSSTKFDHSHEAWLWILDQMIYSFDLILQDRTDGFSSEEKRIQNGLNLFAKYYRSLWD